LHLILEFINDGRVPLNDILMVKRRTIHLPSDNVSSRRYAIRLRLDQLSTQVIRVTPIIPILSDFRALCFQSLKNRFRSILRHANSRLLTQYPRRRRSRQSYRHKRPKPSREKLPAFPSLEQKKWGSSPGPSLSLIFLQRFPRPLN
jgi:hypothetical protein